MADEDQHPAIRVGQELDLGDGRLPLWVFDEARRVPDTSLRDYLALMPLIWAGTDKLVGKLQERYGWKKAQAEREADSWIDSIND